MKNQTNRLAYSVLLFLLLLYSTVSFGQLKAGFTSSVTSGCSPVFVEFKDVSTGGPTQWNWNLGNGNTSSQQNPGAIYTNPGTYTVSLEVANASGQDSITQVNYITVYAEPTVSFNATPTSGCSPLPVQFTDVSNPGSGTSSQWAWDFGDGQTSTSQNPLHAYTTVGNFSVSLTVTNSFGCSNFAQQPSLISVNGVIDGDFSYSYSNACSPPTAVTFNAVSNSSAALNYQWFFGDGGSSGQQNPVYTYNKNGKYNVQLIVSTAQGCSDTVTKNIAIGTVFPNFTMPSGGCVNKNITFTDSSSPTPIFVNWNFGDGKTGVGLTAFHKYTAVGSYDVKLVADFGTCSDSITKVFTVTNKPGASFTSTGNRATCAVPSAIQFNNTSSNGVSFIWSFGDGAQSTQASPLHNYTKAGFYDVTLIAFNSNGCSDTIIMPKYVQLGPPRIDSLLNAPFAGCVPKTINFQAAISSGDPVVSYKWYFGDGGTSTNATPTYKYVNPGTYGVQLVVYTQSGCTDSVNFNETVFVGSHPVAKFTATPNNACSSVPIQFTDQSTGAVTDWYWHFGDSAVGITQNPTHLYTDTGFFSVTLVVGSNGCLDSTVKHNYIYINPPIAKFNFTSPCGQRLIRNFKDSSIGAKTWAWTFGDDSTSTLQNPTHTYKTGGAYIVTLTVTNSSCTSTKVDTLNILDSTISFIYSPLHITFCKYDTVRFTATNYDTSSVSSYYWLFGDGTASGFNPAFSSIVHRYVKSGNFTPVLIVQETNGCKDSVKRPGLFFKVLGPTANFTNTNGVCLNGIINFIDQSLPDTVGNYPIKQWTWNFGDGTIQTFTGPPFQHQYTKTGFYSVELKVQDGFGCIDTLLKANTDTITNPVALLSLADSVSCLKSMVDFIDSSNGVALTYLWNFGDGTTSTLPAPQHLYQKLGTYSVSLKVTDEFGCTNSITKKNYVEVDDPTASITLKDSVQYCPPMRIEPTSTVANYTFLTWNFGDGNSSNQNDPIHTYTIPGVYNLQLIAKGHGACYDTASKVVTLYGPSGSFVYTPLSLCDSGTVHFTVIGHNVVGYEWDFGGGGAETVKTPDVSYSYQTPGLYLPKLLIVDSANCSVQLQNIFDTIRVVSLKSKFTYFTQPGCDSAAIILTDSSQILYDNLTSFIWNFGDGTTSTSTNPVHYYSTPGDKTVSLSLGSSLNCKSNYNLPIHVTIYQAPVIGATIPPSICINSAGNFEGVDNSVPIEGITWHWQFGDGDTSSLQNPSYTYIANNTYNVSVIGTNMYGCADTINGITIAQPLPPVDAGQDSIICLGTFTQLLPSGAVTYSWAADPTLSCTNCASPLARPDSTTTYYVTGTSSVGCQFTDSVVITVERPITLTLSPVDTLCIGGSLQLNASGAQIYNWQPSTGLNSTTIANPIASPSSTTTYMVIGTDVKQCFFDTATTIVNVYNNPTVNILDSNTTIMAGGFYGPSTTVSPDVVKWLWSPPIGLSCDTCANPIASPRQTTTYEVKVFNQYGCSAEDVVTVTVLCNQKSLFIPNTFSPNGDGMNDYFFPRGGGLYNIKSMLVFNRWGQVVFENLNFPPNDMSSGWDGKFKGQPQPSDVYVYVMQVICDNGTVITTKGNVTLLR